MTWKCPKCGREFSKKDQQHFCGKPQTIDEYIAAQDERVQSRLDEIRAILRKALPEAEECISWSMPTYRKGRNIIHFAAFKKHIGVYPGGEATEKFAEELAEYDTSKGTIRLPYDRELPEDLLVRIAQWCYEKYKK
ncbi:MAG: DUF1801 domain-containing protein [Erysipelotrichaceae bacterium]|nr:DUF1801 domain-containing protein [Erysipelotrichaceae bacterium]